MDQAASLPSLLVSLKEKLPALHAALLAESEGTLAVIHLSAGESLIRQGENATAMYILAQGTLCATAQREDGSEFVLSEFGPGEVAGEMALLTGGGVYSASVSATGAAVVVKVSAEAFERIGQRAPEAIAQMSEGIRQRIARDQLATSLSRLFGPMSQTALKYVESQVQWVRLRAGEELFEIGGVSQDLYFVVSGRLRAIAADGAILSEIARGESIGEVALLTGEPRSATILAVRDSDLVRLSKEVFDQIIEKYPKVMQAIAQVVVRRLRTKEKSDHGPARTGICLAVLAIGGQPLPPGFTQRLVKAFERIGPALHLCAQRVDQALNRPRIANSGQESAGGIRLNAWLGDQESNYRFIVYETESKDCEWTRRCLRQADEILLVAQASGHPAAQGLETTLIQEATSAPNARQTLLLLHPSGQKIPSTTDAWLAGRAVHRHFHLREDGEGDFQRVARCLAGTATGLVFGGGGARGLAHIGVIRAFAEAGLPVDMIGGTSMGAVISAAFGMGLDWKEILEISRTGWLKYKPHKEYTLPMVSLIRSRVLDRWAKDVYGNTNIEDLWLSFFCVACNLTASEMVLLDRGPLWKAVRASSALPGIFVPVMHDGSVFVDGAVVNNLPGDLMRKRACQTVIVVDVGSERGFSFGVAEFPSPWQLFWSYFLPFVKKVDVPNIAALLLRTTEVSSNQKAVEVKRDADVCLRPPIDKFGILDFESIDQIVETGYRYTLERLASMNDDTRFSKLFAS
ncbi:MAG: cyclic nucleotide-binding domain-containing protein [Burkholderiales bacterium]